MIGRRHPFTGFVVEVPLPDKWKGFNRDCYDGTTDPDEHMDAYTAHMSLYTTDDAVLCRVFPTSLKGALWVGTTRRYPRQEETSMKRDHTPPKAREDDRRHERRTRRDDPPRDDWRRSREVINTIAGGFAWGGSSNSARKKHLRAIHQVNFVAIRGCHLSRSQTMTSKG